MKEFLAKKGKGYLFSLVAILSTVVGLIFFRMLTVVSVEQSERPVLVITLAFVAILFDLIATYKDYAKVPSIVAYAITTALFFSLLEGRVSYLAFYFSGDVLDTGLSPYLVIAFLLFFLAMVFTLFAVVCKQEKDEQYSFRVKDLKVVIPMILVIGILCGVAVANSSGSVGTDWDTVPGNVSSPSVSTTEPDDSVDDLEATANYLSPTTPEEVWQNYSKEDYVAEDVSSKPIAYQLIGYAEVDAGGPTPFDAILNLYGDGEAVLSVYGMGRATEYYGYWTNEKDEHLWFCVTCYTMEGASGVCTIDYAYELTEHFNEVTVNIALGFADGGQYVREMPIGGDGSVTYTSTEEFLREKGWEPAPPVEDAPGSEPETNEGTDREDAPLFSFVSDSENYLLDCYGDGTYQFTFVTAGLVEVGEWSWQDWTFTLTDANGKVTTAEMDDESHSLNLHFEAAATDMVNRDFTCDAVTWGTALGTTGSYTSAAKASLLFSFVSDSENYVLDCYDDNTYQFTFVTAGLIETGEWSWQDWTFTLTDVNGKVTTAEMDDESHALNLHFEAAATDMVNRDFICDAVTWGTALGTTGSYDK